MNDRERWDLRGPVRSCRIERTWYFRCCGQDACETEERSDASSLQFRADGSLARQGHKNPDGSEWTSTHQYDDQGRLLMVVGEFGLQVYDYDDAGRAIRRRDRSKDGTERIAESYSYDAAGRKTKTFYVDLAAQRPNTHYAWGVEGSDTHYSAPGAATLTTSYDECEHPTELLFHDVAGRLVSRVEFRYDQAGCLVEEAQTHFAETLPTEMMAQMNPAQMATARALFGAAGEPIRRLHWYDERGRRIETRSKIGPLGEDRRTAAYNEHGDQIEEVFEHTEREYGMDEQGQLSERPTKEVTRSEARFRYEYDAHGNWVEKVIEGRGREDEDFTVSSVERRTLSY
jgi:YD repeat-containing protein